jgi:hypothetical protein
MVMKWVIMMALPDVPHRLRKTKALVNSREVITLRSKKRV